MINSAPGAAVTEHAPVPTWDWGNTRPFHPNPGTIPPPPSAADSATRGKRWCAENRERPPDADDHHTPLSDNAVPIRRIDARALGGGKGRMIVVREYSEQPGSGTRPNSYFDIRHCEGADLAEERGVGQAALHERHGDGRRSPTVTHSCWRR